MPIKINSIYSNPVIVDKKGTVLFRSRKHVDDDGLTYDFYKVGLTTDDHVNELLHLLNSRIAINLFFLRCLNNKANKEQKGP
jgi:hypothetical protein